MIVTQDIARIAQALLKDTTGSLVEATWQSLTPLNLTPGQMVHGEVMANLANSRYLVRIANELLRMEIPLNLQPGQAVELTYVTDEPRLLFALSKSANSATPVQISDTGRWLNTLAQGAGDAPAASPLPRPSLVISGPPRDPALLAEGLKNVLTRSGVFYESHVAQWVRGERPLADLLREPQGQLSPLAGRMPAEGSGAPLTPQGTQAAPAAQTPPPTTTPSPMTAGTPPPEEAVIPVSPRPLSPQGGPQQQGTTSPATGQGVPTGETPSAAAMVPPKGGQADTAMAPPKGGQAPAAEPREPLPPAGTQPAPQNQPPPPGRPGEPSAPLPAQHQQTGTSAPSPQPPTASAGAPQPKPAGEVAAQQPATAAPQEGHAPQPREAIVLRPAEDGRPAPATMPDPRAAADNQPQPSPRDGAPSPAFSKNSAAPPLPGPPDGSQRSTIPGEAAPADRGGAGRPAAPPPPAGVEPQTIPLIKEQLATLTTGVFTWFGQAWPGQEMEWKVEEREAEGGDRRERSWLTEVAVELPTLGSVRAVLRSGKEGIAVTLTAGDGRTADILAAGQNGLEERFGAAGLKLGGFTVRDGTQ